MSSQLAGRRVLVTRATHQAGKLSEGLRAHGAIPVEVPVLEIQPPASFDPLDRSLRQLHAYDWLILTSTNAVNAIAERAKILSVPLMQREFHVAAVGEATAEATRRIGINVTLVPEQYVAESLLKTLSNRLNGRRVLLARAAVARDLIPDALRASGATVNVVDAYRNVVPAAAPEQLRKALAEGIDAATFTSSSSVAHLAEAAKAAKIPFPLIKIPAVSIGPVTSQTLRDFQWPAAIEANPSDIPGLVSAVIRLFQSSMSN